MSKLVRSAILLRAGESGNEPPLFVSMTRLLLPLFPDEVVVLSLSRLLPGPIGPGSRLTLTLSRLIGGDEDGDL